MKCRRAASGWRESPAPRSACSPTRTAARDATTTESTRLWRGSSASTQRSLPPGAQRAPATTCTRFRASRPGTAPTGASGCAWLRTSCDTSMPVAEAGHWQEGPLERMDSMIDQVSSVVDSALQLRGRLGRGDASTPLLGAIPELDSMAVVSLISALEEHFGFAVADDEIEAATFATLGSLSDFVQQKLDT